MDIIGTLVIAGVIVGLLEIYRAHKNHATFKTEATNDLTYLKSRVSYLEQRAFQVYATRVDQNTTPPPTA